MLTRHERHGLRAPLRAIGRATEAAPGPREPWRTLPSPGRPRRPRREPLPWRGSPLDRNRLGLRGDGAGEAELGDLPGEALRLLLGCTLVKVLGPEVAPEGAVAQHVPGGREHGGGDGADRLLGAAALAQPLELGPEIAVLFARCRPGALHEGGLPPARALAQPVGPPLAGALVVARAETGPGNQVAGGGEAVHVGADLGDDGPGGEVADAGDGPHTGWERAAAAWAELPPGKTEASSAGLRFLPLFSRGLFRVFCASTVPFGAAR